MDRASLEAKLPRLQARHTELLDESKRVEGEFRAINNLLNEWPKDQDEAAEAQEGDIVNAEAESS